jgi:hypothetical protein
VVAAAVAVGGLALGWRGVDLPAQLYRVELWRRNGFALWDSQWFAGHWLLSYSVLFPPLAAILGTGVVTVAAAVVAAVCWDRLLAGRIGHGERAASLVFAVGVAVQVAIGQLTFLTGEAAGLACLLLAARRRWWAAGVFGVVSSLCSPLDGSFVCLAMAAVVLHDRRSGRTWSVGPLSVLVATGTVAAVLSLAFPGDGPMPYPFLDFLWELGIAAGAWLAAGRRRPLLRTGVGLYAVAIIGAYAVASPLGGNIGRLEDVAAVPLAVALLWRRRLVLAVLAVPLVLSQWTPAWAAMTTGGSVPWTHRAYFQPLVAWLQGAGGPPGRVEVVPTAAHYETAYVAPQLALARGWERQLDIADDPIFYRPGALDDASYRSWLLADGVRWVALSTAPTDGAGRAEARLLEAGVPGLTPVWSGDSWRVWRVDGGTGLVGAGASVLSAGGGRVALEVAAAGPVELRERWTSAWRVTAGRATLREAPGGWIIVDAAAPGPVRIEVGLPRL